jgi:hypothetical protein
MERKEIEISPERLAADDRAHLGAVSAA